MTVKAVLLTSYWAASMLGREWKVVSGSRWSPRGYEGLEVAEWMKPLDERGIVGVRRWGDPEPYTDYLVDLYRSRSEEVDRWIADMESYRHVAACCWCPRTKAASRQLREFGTFVCHMGAVGLYLAERDVTVAFDRDRRDRMWKRG